jgi:hypothetical protein
LCFRFVALTRFAEPCSSLTLCRRRCSHSRRRCASSLTGSLSVRSQGARSAVQVPLPPARSFLSLALPGARRPACVPARLLESARLFCPGHGHHRSCRWRLPLPASSAHASCAAATAPRSPVRVPQGRGEGISIRHPQDFWPRRRAYGSPSRPCPRMRVLLASARDSNGACVALWFL